MTRRVSQYCLSANRRPAFTLIELVVVIGIILLLIGITAPAVGPALNSNQQTQAVHLLTSAITMAQTRAENRGGYALRIERAFKTDQRGFMVDANGQTRDNAHPGLPNFDPTSAPVWLPYQQIRFLNPPKEIKAYRPAIDAVIPLPKNVWIGPDYALDTTSSTPFLAAHFSGTLWPTSTTRNFQLNPFDTFCIAFDQRGNIVQIRPGVTSDNYAYYDETQPERLPDGTLVPPFTNYPYNSARGVIVYDRRSFEARSNAHRADFLASEGRPLYINRFLGTLVEARNP